MGKAVEELVVDEAVRMPPKRKMSYEEFLEWCDEDRYFK